MAKGAFMQAVKDFFVEFRSIFSGNDVLKENKVSPILFETIEKTAQKAFELGKK